MDTRFTEIDAADVKNSFPKFYDPLGRFFEIIHKTNPIGFVGIRSLGPEHEGDCELSVFVFRQCGNVLTKGIVFAVLGLPQSLGFRRCWMKSARPTVIKLLNAMEKYGIKRVVSTPGKTVFVREC